MDQTAEGDGPIEVFHLPTGHRVEVHHPGALGVRLYSDHRVVLLEDTGSPEENRARASAAVASRKA